MEDRANEILKKLIVPSLPKVTKEEEEIKEILDGWTKDLRKLISRSAAKKLKLNSTEIIRRRRK